MIREILLAVDVSYIPAGREALVVAGRRWDISLRTRGFRVVIGTGQIDCLMLLDVWRMRLGGDRGRVWRFNRLLTSDFLIRGWSLSIFFVGDIMKIGMQCCVKIPLVCA